MTICEETWVVEWRWRAICRARNYLFCLHWFLIWRRLCAQHYMAQDENRRTRWTQVETIQQNAFYDLVCLPIHISSQNIEQKMYKIKQQTWTKSKRWRGTTRTFWASNKANNKVSFGFKNYNNYMHKMLLETQRMQTKRKNSERKEKKMQFLLACVAETIQATAE